MALRESAGELIRSGAVGHLVTIGPDGTPQVTCDPRVAISFEGTRIRPPGLREYLVVDGRATIEDGGAPELLQELARVHLGPDVRFPPMENPPAGVRLRIAVERVGGIGPWSD